jgi:hypothetical protein
MATVLITSAAAIATRVRLKDECDDIYILPFLTRLLPTGRCHFPIKERAKPGKLRKIVRTALGWEISPTKSWWRFPSHGWEHSSCSARRIPQRKKQEQVMIGKLFGAWLGEKVAGRNEGAKGAILGYGAAALARRSVPTLAALALGGWAYRKWRDRRRSNPSYPSEATPSS